MSGVQRALDSMPAPLWVLWPLALATGFCFVAWVLHIVDPYWWKK